MFSLTCKEMCCFYALRFSLELYCWPQVIHLCIFFFQRVAAEGSGTLFMRNTSQGATGFS